MKNVSQRPLGKAIDTCEHGDLIRYYLTDFISYKFPDVSKEFYEVI